MGGLRNGEEEMEKFSVQKPLVLVGVVMVLLLGFVALSHMQTNLLHHTIA